MKPLYGFVGVLIVTILLSAAAIAQNKFVGAKFCGTCHKSGKAGTAYLVWEKSAHAKAYETLLGEKAKKVAQEKGLKKPPHESEDCLKCHVTGGGAAENIEATFKIEDGVSCEACHGAASAYKSLHNKGNLEKSKAAGLIEGDKTGKACEKCHNVDSPSFSGFDFKEKWAKIAHSLPVKK